MQVPNNKTLISNNNQVPNLLKPPLIQIAAASEELSELPLELWRTILALALAGSDHVCNHMWYNILKVLRARSRTLREASNAYLTNIRMSNTEIDCRAFKTKDLARLVSVTVIFIDEDNICNDLCLLSCLAPNITSVAIGSTSAGKAAIRRLNSAALKRLASSLEQTSGSQTPAQHDELSASLGLSQYMYESHMTFKLRPWEHILKHLCLKGCSLTVEFQVPDFDSSMLTLWSPKFPELLSLCLDRCVLNHLRLGGCGKLRTLGLTGNPLLMSVELSSVTFLSKVTCMCNPILVEFSLYTCTQLKEVVCRGNHRDFCINTLLGMHLPNMCPSLVCYCPKCVDSRKRELEYLARNTGMLSRIGKVIGVVVRHMFCCNQA